MDAAGFGSILLGVAAVITAFGNRRRSKKHTTALEEINAAVNHVGPEGTTLTSRMDEVVKQGNRTFMAIGRVEGQIRAHTEQDERTFAELKGTLRDLADLKEILYPEAP